jgi:hypothetical protein
MKAIFGAILMLFAAQVFAEPVSIEHDLDGNASALHSS